MVQGQEDNVKTAGSEAMATALHQPAAMPVTALIAGDRGLHMKSELPSALACCRCSCGGGGWPRGLEALQQGLKLLQQGSRRLRHLQGPVTGIYNRVCEFST